MKPEFYKAENVADALYQPSARSIMEYVKSSFSKTPPTKDDKKRILLLLIDVQRDFCHTDAPLFVSGRSGDGAINDNRRLTEFIYREVGRITSILPTLDTHLIHQIFTPSFWHDQHGKALEPHDQIDQHFQIVRGGAVTDLRPHVNEALAYEALEGIDPEWLQKHAEYYCRTLIERGKPNLYIWPEHCQLGTIGHTLVGAVQEAILYHGYARESFNTPVLKGDNPLTECYSVFGPEIMDTFDNSGPIANKNWNLLQSVAAFDAIIVAGQALSHCVRSSVDDLLLYLKVKQPRLVDNLYILVDCMSPVVVPGVVDYTDESNQALRRWDGEGMKIVCSTDPMESWMSFK